MNAEGPSRRIGLARALARLLFPFAGVLAHPRCLEVDFIEVDHQPLVQQDKTYFMLNKRAGW